MIFYGLIKNRLDEWQVYTRGNTREAVREDLLPLEKAGIPLEKIKIVKALSKEDGIVPWVVRITYFDGKVKENKIHKDTWKNGYLEFLSLVHICMSNHRNEIYKVELCSICGDTEHVWINELGKGIYDTRVANSFARLANPKMLNNDNVNLLKKLIS